MEQQKPKIGRPKKIIWDQRTMQELSGLGQIMVTEVEAAGFFGVITLRHVRAGWFGSRFGLLRLLRQKRLGSDRRLRGYRNFRLHPAFWHFWCNRLLGNRRRLGGRFGDGRDRGDFRFRIDCGRKCGIRTLGTLGSAWALWTFRVGCRIRQNGNLRDRVLVFTRDGGWLGKGRDPIPAVGSSGTIRAILLDGWPIGDFRHGLILRLFGNRAGDSLRQQLGEMVALGFRRLLRFHCLPAAPS
jgi:hypothetical protein